MKNNATALLVYDDKNSYERLKSSLKEDGYKTKLLKTEGNSAEVWDIFGTLKTDFIVLKAIIDYLMSENGTRLDTRMNDATKLYAAVLLDFIHKNENTEGLGNKIYDFLDVCSIEDIENMLAENEPTCFQNILYQQIADFSQAKKRELLLVVQSYIEILQHPCFNIGKRKIEVPVTSGEAYVFVGAEDDEYKEKIFAIATIFASMRTSRKLEVAYHSYSDCVLFPRDFVFEDAKIEVIFYGGDK